MFLSAISEYYLISMLRVLVEMTQLDLNWTQVPEATCFPMTHGRRFFQVNPTLPQQTPLTEV